MGNDTVRAPLVLLIEDDRTLSNMYSEKFRLSGIQVVTAADGEEGLAAAKNSMPDVILLDMFLPKRHGMSVLEEMSKDNSLKAIPIIALTNMADKRNALQAQQLGVREYLVKAMSDPERVVNTVRKYCL